MTPDLDAATQHTLDLCARIAAHTDVPGTITRLFLSPAAREVHSLLLAEMHALGMQTHTDALGNLHGLYSPPLSSGSAAEGSALAFSAPALLLGSHIDTVPNAGPYDGILGIALALALLRALRATGTRLPYPIHLIAFSEEEGVRFQLPFLGSRHFTNTLPPEALDRTDAAGITLAQASSSFSSESPSSPAPWLSSRSASGVPGEQSLLAGVKAEGSAVAPQTPAAFLELHIEQGPVLDSLSLPLGIVTTIVGQSRFELTFTGVANHAGTTPMHLRHDALTAAARFITAVEAHARTIPGLVATVGVIHASPGAINVVPGICTCSLDVRHCEDSVRTHHAQHLLALAHQAAAARGLVCDTRETSSQASVPMNAQLCEALAASVAATGHTPHRLPSGAGHDAMILAVSGIPTAMLFLRSPNGLSHHPDESVHAEDVHAALATLLHFLQNFRTETIHP